MKRKKKLTRFKLLLVIMVATMIPLEVWAGTKLAWTENTEKINGYRLYCRAEDGEYNFSNPIYDGTEIQLDLSGFATILPAGGIYFIVRSYIIDSEGQIIESLNSNEVYINNNDSDNDGLSLLLEQYYGTDPNVVDSVEVEMFCPVEYLEWTVVNDYFYGIKRIDDQLILHIVYLMDRTDSGEKIPVGMPGDELVSFGYADTDGDGINEIEIEFSGTSGDYAGTYDSLTGGLISASSTAVTEYCTIEYYNDMDFGEIDGEYRLVMYGYCAETDQAVLMIFDPDTNAEAEKQIVVDDGIPINVSIVPDRNGDNVEDFFVSVGNTAVGSKDITVYNE